MRRRVRCWFCGNRARRAPNTKGISLSLLDDAGRVRVVGRKRTVESFGVCGASLPGDEKCTEPMLTRADARFILRAALAHDRAGRNDRSEYDL